MAEVLFYHLVRTDLERVLPDLLERSLQRGWCAKVQVGSAERVSALNAHLWTYRDDAFLPHGTAEDGSAREQPIYLSDDEENPNAASVLFLVDGAQSVALEGYVRCVLIFDGREESAVAAARGQWKELKALGHDLTYWQQDENGRWQKRG